jgi:hypothetical protein
MQDLKGDDDDLMKDVKMNDSKCSFRYAAMWTGDNVAEWEHLQASIKICLSVSVSGEMKILSKL